MAAPTPQGSQKTTATGVNSLTMSINGGSTLPGTNRHIFADAGWETNRTVSALTYGTQALTAIGTNPQSEATSGKDVHSFSAAEAVIAAASNTNLVWTFNANIIDGVFIVDWVSDCDPTTPVSGVQVGAAFNPASATGGTAAVTSSADAIVRGVCVWRDSDGLIACNNAGSSEVQQEATGGGAASSHVMEVSYIPGGTSVTPSWTVSGHSVTPAYTAKAYSVNGIAGGGGASVSPGFGEIVAAGFAPTVQTPRVVAVGFGEVTATGFAPTVSLPVTISTGFGQSVVTGFEPTVQTPVTVSPDVGTATLTGFAPAILTPVTATPGTGLLTITGFAPTLGNAISVEPGLGELIATGLAPTVQAATSAAPGTGLLTLTGFAPTITLPATVSAGFGELIATGFQPTIGDVLVNIVIDPFVLNLSPTMTVRNLSPTGTARNVSPTVVARRK